MKELRFREVGQEYKIKVMDSNEVDEKVEGLRIKPFYTIGELATIYKDMKAKDNALDRYYLKLCQSAIVLTNIDFEGYEVDEIFDVCSELGLAYEFSIVTEEFNELDRMIEKDESLYNGIMNLTKTLNDTLGKIKLDEKLSGFMGQLENAKNVGGK